MKKSKKGVGGVWRRVSVAFMDVDIADGEQQQQQQISTTLAFVYDEIEYMQFQL